MKKHIGKVIKTLMLNDSPEMIEEFSRKTKLSPDDTNELFKGNYTPTIQNLRSFARYFGTNFEFWMNLQIDCYFQDDKKPSKSQKIREEKQKEVTNE